MTGLELIDLLRAKKPGLKVLLMSGYSGEPARGDLAHVKGVTYLHKPSRPAFWPKPSATAWIPLDCLYAGLKARLEDAQNG